MSDQFDLAMLPLSAYTPGQGDPKMEGGYETATGAPMYTFEDYIKNPKKIPYVTGATSNKDLLGMTVTRTVGGRQVPIKLTDYGPGPRGIDIASSNPEWATNFPYQGHTELTANSPLVTGSDYRGGTGSNTAQMGTPEDLSKLTEQDARTKAAIDVFAKGIQNAADLTRRSGQESNARALAMLQKKGPSGLDVILQRMNASNYRPPPLYGADYT